MKNMSIGTHNGTFHVDEVLACAMLKHLPEYAEANIVRSRDPEVLSGCEIVVDVGGIFDPKSNRFDHHQRGFDLTFQSFFPESTWDIKLSSAGLVYVHYGERVLSSLLKKSSDDPLCKELFRKLYEAFISEVDAMDNGVSLTDGPTRYNVNTSLSARIKRMNPRWNAPEQDETACFHEALKVVDEEFVGMVLHYANSWYPAREYVMDAIEHRFEVDPSGKILYIQKTGCPWINHFFDVEEGMQKMDARNGDSNGNSVSCIPRTVLYGICKRNDSTWSIQAIPVNRNDLFKSRLSLPSSWRGLRSEELSKVTGIPGCVFVHATGFLGINTSFEGAVRMGLRAIELATVVN